MADQIATILKKMNELYDQLAAKQAEYMAQDSTTATVKTLLNLRLNMYVWHGNAQPQLYSMQDWWCQVEERDPWYFFQDHQRGCDLEQLHHSLKVP